jgi:hypothetical protein
MIDKYSIWEHYFAPRVRSVPVAVGVLEDLVHYAEPHVEESHHHTQTLEPHHRVTVNIVDPKATFSLLTFSTNTVLFAIYLKTSSFNFC